MKIQYMSDLHFEFHSDGGKSILNEIKPLADVLVLAGDIIPLTFYKNVFEVYSAFCDKFKHVVMVPGNHEFYGTNPSEAKNLLRTVEEKLPNLHFLDSGEMVKIDGRRFIGGTMWYEFKPDNVFFSDCMNDGFQIKNFVPWVYSENKSMMDFLTGNLRAGDIVVSHHVPSNYLVSQEYKNSDSNRFFVCEMGNMMADKSPAAWFYGHTHHKGDAVIGNTKCLVNALGYPMEKSVADFDPNAIVEV